MTAGVGVIIVMHRLRVIVSPIICCVNCFVVPISAFFASEPNPLVLHQLVPVSGSPATRGSESASTTFSAVLFFDPTLPDDPFSGIEALPMEFAFNVLECKLELEN